MWAQAHRLSAMAAIGWAPQAFTQSLHSINLGTKLSIFTSSGTASGFCHSAKAVKGEVDAVRKGAGDKDAIEDVKRIIESANRASLRREVLHTDFLTPPVLRESMQALDKFADIKMVAQGGYPEAERCRLSVGHPEVLTSDPDIVAALSISGNFSFEPCSHGDFLGAILGTGIVRDKLGDIILQGEKGAHLLVVQELVDFLASSLDKVRNVSVTCEKIPLLALEYQPPRTKTMKTVEASVRLDSIASAGFKISRSKMANLIRMSSSMTYLDTVDLEGFDIEDEVSDTFLPCSHFKKKKRCNKLIKDLARKALHLFRDDSGKQYEFVSMVKGTFSRSWDYYLTFTARQKDNPDVLKTIQAVVKYMHQLYDHSDVLLCRIKPTASSSSS